MSDASDALADQILEEARSKAEPILRRAQRQAAETERRAREEAAERRDQILSRARERASAEEHRVQARTELEALNIRRGAREEIFNQMRERAMAKMRELPADENYPEALLQLAFSGLKAMSGRRFELLMRSEDRDRFGERLAKELRDRAADELGRQVTVNVADEQIEAAGGLLVQREDGRQLCDQTFEALLERMWPELREAVAEILTPEEVKAAQSDSDEGE